MHIHLYIFWLLGACIRARMLVLNMISLRWKIETVKSACVVHYQLTVICKPSLFSLLLSSIYVSPLFLPNSVVIWCNMLGGVQSGSQSLSWYWESWDSGAHLWWRKTQETHSLPWWTVSISYRIASIKYGLQFPSDLLFLRYHPKNVPQGRLDKIMCLSQLLYQKTTGTWNLPVALVIM